MSQLGHYQLGYIETLSHWNQIIFFKIVVMFDTFIVINYNKCIEGGVRHETI